MINGDETKIHNHRGHIELNGSADGGTRVDYTVSFDYKPPWQGPITSVAMRAGWALRGRRRLANAFPG